MKQLTIALVGYTGFVGTNIDLNGNIDKKYNSKNITESRFINLFRS